MKDKIISFIWQHVLLLTFFLAYIQTTEAKGLSSYFSYGASMMNGDLYCGHQEDSVFAMHSVMKFPQALYVADYLHKKGLTLSDSVLVHKDSLDAETWSPMLSIFEGMRYFTFAELIEWSLKQSDNNACDLLFASCGQPDAVENYIHTLGFKDIHVRLTEKEMKKNPHRAIENSATPKEMARLLEWFYLHRNDNKNLSFIWDTMADCNTGQQRIAAVLPKDGKLIHKTGSGFPSSDGRQDRNDVGIVLLPDGSHLSIAIFLQKSKEEKEVAKIAEQCLQDWTTVSLPSITSSTMLQSCILMATTSPLAVPVREATLLWPRLSTSMANPVRLNSSIT